jgi:hypothetical protein
MQKQCFKCRAVLGIHEFYRHPQMADGHLNKCKLCARLDVNANRIRRLEYYRGYDRNRGKRGRSISGGKAAERYLRLHPKKAAARVATRNAICSGLLIRQPCEICGHNPAEAHHDDYDKPLGVRWLCTKHHAEHHKLERKRQRDARLQMEA